MKKFFCDTSRKNEIAIAVEHHKHLHCKPCMISSTRNYYFISFNFGKKMKRNSSPYLAEMMETAGSLMAHGRGILAADESTGTIGKRFSAIQVENTVENRRNYRQMLITTDGIEQFISGVILCEETLYQCTKEGVSFVDVLRAKHIIPGIKVDLGTVLLHGTNGEYVTQGLDNLNQRCKQYHAQGARFAKWRAVFYIRDIEGATPSSLAISANIEALARYASICQHNGLVPILEPEVICDGDFVIEVVEAATEKVLSQLFKAVLEYNVTLEATILKPNMIRSGSGAAVQAWPADIGAATVRVMKRTVPSAVKGIAFLSGGMTEEQAILSLNAINQDARAGGIQPWPLTFSFGRALQYSCLKAWQGSDDRVNVVAAQKALFAKGKASSYASTGGYYSSIQTLQN